jgi:hypothetical protein
MATYKNLVSNYLNYKNKRQYSKFTFSAIVFVIFQDKSGLTPAKLKQHPFGLGQLSGRREMRFNFSIFQRF